LEASKVLEENLLLDPQHHKSLVLLAKIFLNDDNMRDLDKSLGLYLTAIKHKETAEIL
jgi:hypothetical protein